MAGKILTDALRFLPHKRYQILRQLGHHTGRQTLLAYDLKRDEPVVIKLFTFYQTREENELQQFKQEAETLKSLSHHHIPQYLDCFEMNTPDAIYMALVQRFVQGRSLQECLHRGQPFTETDIKESLKDLLSILIYLHGQDPPVSHRNIKPSNILVGESSGQNLGPLHLVDFGSVRTPETPPNLARIGYRPPKTMGEQAALAFDLYGVGGVAIALITGKDPISLPQKQPLHPLESSTSLSPALTAWIKHITDPNPDRRFLSAQAALEALDNSRLRWVSLPLHLPHIPAPKGLWNRVWRP